MTITGRRKLEIGMIAVLACGLGCVGMWSLGPIWGVRIGNLNIIGMFILVCGAVTGFLAYHHRLGVAMDAMRVRLHYLSEDEEHGQVRIGTSRSLQGLLNPLENNLVHLETHVDELRCKQRGLRIRRQVAEVRTRQLEGILHASCEAILVVNKFDELIFANRAAERMLNFHFGDGMRRNVDEFLQDGTMVRLIRETRKRGLNQPRRHVEHCSGIDPAARVFSMTLHCEAGPDGALAAVVIMMRDITREKVIEQSKVEFVSNVAHELKTPLASIKAYIEMLLDGEVEDPTSTKEFYETISEEAERLHRMIDRLVKISRIESGGERISLEPVSMTAVIKQVVGVVVPQARAKNITIEESLAPVFYQVQADYDLICQAVQNLLTNAIKYTNEGGSITLRVTADERREVVVLDVSDTGTGISAEELPRIFEKFYRSKKTTSMAQGTGLGLSLVKFIVEQIHGGTLSVTSEPGRGSTFSFELPLVA